MPDQQAIEAMLREIVERYLGEHSAEFEYIAAPEEDFWYCVCLNTPAYAGFQPCTVEGDLIDPEPGSWRGHLVCQQCGRVASQKDYSPVTRNVRVLGRARWAAESGASAGATQSFADEPPF